jgi:hypothetical protein
LEHVPNSFTIVASRNFSGGGGWKNISAKAGLVASFFGGGGKPKNNSAKAAMAAA